MDKIRTPRIASTFLFLGGVVLLWLFYAGSQFTVGFSPLGRVTVVGYVIWILWLVRAIWILPIKLRKMLWLLSLSWHAMTIAICIPFLPYLIKLPHGGLKFMMPWSLLAFVISIIMFKFDDYEFKKA